MSYKTNLNSSKCHERLKKKTNREMFQRLKQTKDIWQINTTYSPGLGQGDPTLKDTTVTKWNNLIRVLHC